MATVATEKEEKEKSQVRKAENRMPKWVLPSVKIAIVMADAILAFSCFALAFILREGKPIFSQTAWAWSKEFVPYAGVILFAVPARVATLAYSRVYRFQGAFSYIAEAIKVFKATVIGSLLLIAFTFLFRGGFAFREFSYSRGVFLIDFALSLFVFTAFHLAIRYVQTVFRRRGINLIPTLIVGVGRDAKNTIREIIQRPELGYKIIGIVSVHRNEKRSEVMQLPIVGSINELPSLVRELEIQEVIITDDRISTERLFEIMMQIGRKQRVEFRFAPSLFNLMPQKTNIEQIGVLPMVRLFCEPLSETERFIKRSFDILVSSLAILITSPIWLVVAILIKLDSRGPVFFKQERVGMDGRIFLCYKFRTMKADADESLHKEIYKKNIAGLISEANAGDHEKPVFGKVKNDPRVTRVGKYLRRFSIDELPQFLNVLKGEMSIVGPRPPIPYEVEEYEPWHRKRLEVKPGITGLWQVSGRNRLPFEEMVKIDLYYIENWSLWLDLKIILLTIPAILRGDGAR
ncbi:MAG: sugar transferase [Acidobacteria bacterium]|jgi:exopolysaccharide biosynthesis polyprenyl glycosylphosphotransferase|nr:MAG: sugar transferase [Acidobacteriota bacterium]GIU81641.1 MAG: UDP-phosphate galactose phosphotransferase [Pyrinomonadaceae bacterium]